MGPLENAKETLAVTVSGDDAHRPLLLLHGFTGSAAAMSGLTRGLSDTHLTVAPDLLGHGRSPAPAAVEAYSTDAQVAALVAMLQQYAPPAAIVGYSMGARLALSLAVSAPQLVERLVLIGGTAGIADEAGRAARRRSDEELASMIEQEGVAAFVDYWQALPLFASQQRLDAQTRATLRSGRLDNSPVGLANSLRGFGTGQMPALWDRLHTIVAPTLVIAGSQDVKYSSLARQLVAGLTHGEAIIIDGVGHAAHIEAPLAVLGAIRRHLESDDLARP